MAKNLLQDMVKKRTIQDIKKEEIRSPQETKVPEQVKSLLQNMAQKKTLEQSPRPEIVKAPEPVKVEQPVKTPESIKVPIKTAEQNNNTEVETKFASVYDLKDGGEGHKKSRHGRLWLVALASAIFLLFSLSFVFSGAKVVINPKIKNTIFNENFTATKNGGEGVLPFELVVISGEENKTIQAVAEKDVSVRAEGRAIIYNAFSASPQPLAIDTRLEGSNGKIYKTKTKLTVPGMKGTTPGSIEVGIYAAEAGAEYNSEPLDFKIFGFKGTPKYAKFYARSNGAITGGFEGKSADLTSLEKEKLVAELRTALQAKLSQKATDQIPSGFILWKNASILDAPVENVVFTPKDNMMLVNMKGTFSGILFEEKQITAKIAEKILPTEDGTAVYMPNLRNLIFTLANPENLPADMTNISFNLSGSLEIVWRVDEEKVIADLLSQQKKNFNDILSKYPSIDSAQLSVRPFWKRSMPDEAGDIKIVVNYPQ